MAVIRAAGDAHVGVVRVSPGGQHANQEAFTIDDPEDARVCGMVFFLVYADIDRVPAARDVDPAIYGPAGGPVTLTSSCCIFHFSNGCWLWHSLGFLRPLSHRMSIVAVPSGRIFR